MHVILEVAKKLKNINIWKILVYIILRAARFDIRDIHETVNDFDVEFFVAIALDFTRFTLPRENKRGISQRDMGPLIYPYT